MKNLIILVILIFLMVFNIYSADKVWHGYKVGHYPYYIYMDAASRINHFYPAYWLGDFRRIRINERFDKDTRSDTCIEIRFDVRSYEDNVYGKLSFPATPTSRWYTIRGGDDLTTAKQIMFYARGFSGGEIVEFQMTDLKGQKSGNNKLTTKAVTLTREWKLYSIPLNNVTIEEIAGGLAVVFTKKYNQQGCTIYMDDICYTDRPCVKKYDPLYSGVY